MICVYCVVLWNWRKDSVWGNVGVEKNQLQLNVKFLVKRGKSRAKINEILAMMYSKDTLKPVMVYNWVKYFQEGYEDIGNDVWSGHSSYLHTKENVNRVRTLMQRHIETSNGL